MMFLFLKKFFNFLSVDEYKFVYVVFYVLFFLGLIFLNLLFKFLIWYVCGVNGL